MDEILQRELIKCDIIGDLCDIVREEFSSQSNAFKRVCKEIAKTSFRLEGEKQYFKGDAVPVSEIETMMRNHLLNGGDLGCMS